MEAVAVDRAGRDHADDDLLRAGQHGVEELLAPLGRALLRVVQEPERADAVVAQRAVVEEDARDDQRPRERPAPGLVDPGDVAGAEAPIEAEEALAGARRGHRARIAPAPARPWAPARNRHERTTNRHERAGRRCRRVTRDDAKAVRARRQAAHARAAAPCSRRASPPPGTGARAPRSGPGPAFDDDRHAGVLREGEPQRPRRTSPRDARLHPGLRGRAPRGRGVSAPRPGAVEGGRDLQRPAPKVLFGTAVDESPPHACVVVSRVALARRGCSVRSTSRRSHG